MKSQKGFSMPGWILIIGFAGFMMMFVIAAVPPYIDNIYVQDALKSLAEENKLGEMEKSQIMKKIDKYFIINRVNNDARKSFEVKKFGNRVLVNSNYEVRSNLMANIDLVVKFENQLDSNNPQACCERLVTNIDETKK